LNEAIYCNRRGSFNHPLLDATVDRETAGKTKKSVDNCCFQLKIAKTRSAADINPIFLQVLQHRTRETAKKIQGCPIA